MGVGIFIGSHTDLAQSNYSKKTVGVNQAKVRNSGQSGKSWNSRIGMNENQKQSRNMHIN